jgi:hypothetical protein
MTSRSVEDLFSPTTPAGAYDALLTRVLPEARDHRLWEPADGPLPSLFVSHGVPPTLGGDVDPTTVISAIDRICFGNSIRSIQVN